MATLKKQLQRNITVLATLFISMHLSAQNLSEDPTAILQELDSKISSGDYGKVHGYILKKDDLVIEKYFNGWKADSLHTMQSVTKSVTSLLIGIALDKGFIASVNDPVSKYLPEYQKYFSDDYHKQITIAEILNMQSGIKWNEVPYDSSNLHKMNISRQDWPEYVLSQPMSVLPGTTFDYNSGSIILLSKIIWNASKMRTDSFAHKYLFEPIEIDSDAWYQSPYDSLPHTGGGLFLSLKDMSKIGTLLLQKGNWNGKQIVSEKWIENYFLRTISTKMGPYNVFYNNLWWVFPEDQSDLDDRSSDIITASGARGQWIMAFKKYNAVFAIIGDNVPDYSVKILYNYILPFLKTYQG